LENLALRILLLLILKVLSIKNFLKNNKGSSIIELIIVTVLFAIIIPSSIAIFVSARKINGQSYVQHSAATTLSETNDILMYLRNLNYNQLVNGDFYLIRNPGVGSWLIKNDLPDMDTFERHINISNAYRDDTSFNICIDSNAGCSLDINTKKIEINILWAPDYIRSDTTSQIVYITNWETPITY